MEKLKKLMDMTEHPEQYSDADWQEVFDGETVSETQTDEAWRAFEARHYSKRRDYRVAASFIGLLLLSGIAVAAVWRPWQHQEPQKPLTEQHVIAPVGDNNPKSEPAEAPKPRIVVFEDAELGQIVDSLAIYYKVKTGYRRDTARHLRLYYEWDQRNTIDEITGMLNHFSQVSIQLRGDSIIIE